MTNKIDKNIIIGDLLRLDPTVAPILMAAGMHCLGCPASQGESLEMACMVHGLDADQITERVNNYFANKKD